MPNCDWGYKIPTKTHPLPYRDALEYYRSGVERLPKLLKVKVKYHHCTKFIRTHVQFIDTKIGFTSPWSNPCRDGSDEWDECSIICFSDIHLKVSMGYLIHFVHRIVKKLTSDQ